MRIAIRSALPLLSTLLLSPSHLSAQSLFLLVDDADQLVGEVASIDAVHVWAALEAPDGEPLFVPYVAEGGDSENPTTILYETSECEDPPYVESVLNTPAMRTGIWANDVELWATMRASFEGILAQSAYHGDFTCTPLESEPFFVREVESLGPQTFTPPLRVIRNPAVLFLDGFGLGNTSHWSTAVPSPAAVVALQRDRRARDARRVER